jgi:hypothetical protein
MPEGPKFEPQSAGNCEVLKCPRPAMYRAIWPNVIKLVCNRHMEEFSGKPWPEVSVRFGSTPPK